MQPDLPTPLPAPVDVRRSIHAAYLNAALWGLGSGLASTTLVLYLARKLGAGGLAISWILAAPSIVGLLRLAAPAGAARVGSRRRFCVAMFLASAATLAALPLLALPGVLPSSRAAVVAIGAAWAGYQLLEYFGVVVLWAWYRDLVPPPIRGRFIARREAWLNGATVVGSLLAIGVTAVWDLVAPSYGAGDIQLHAYITCSLAGAGVLGAAALALLRMSEPARHAGAEAPAAVRLGELVAPLIDPQFRRFLTFGIWFSFSNGIVQAAQAIYPMGPLNLSFAAKKSLDGGSRAVQAALLPGIGAVVDRRGNVPVLALSQALIAVAPLFFLLASPGEPWWIVGAYVCWLAYGGHNVALPGLMLGLSPPAVTASYAAAWFAWTQLAYALSTLAGGWLLDVLRDGLTPLPLGGRPWDHFAVMFIASWVLKSLGVALAARIREPARASDQNPPADPIT